MWLLSNMMKDGIVDSNKSIYSLHIIGYFLKFRSITTGILGWFSFACQPHSSLVGEVVNLDGTLHGRDNYLKSTK